MRIRRFCYGTRLDVDDVVISAPRWGNLSTVFSPARILPALGLVALALVPKIAAAQPVQSGEVLVRVETPLGNIDLAVDTQHAPATAGNFLKYVDAKLYDGGRFHRATRPDNYVPQLPDRPPFQIVQADINPERSTERFAAIPLERTTTTNLAHKAGTLSMPRGAAADSATSGFVICLEDTPSLDFGSKRYPDGQGFAAFGRVVNGLDVVRRIQQQPTNKDADTPMGRQTLTSPVTITRVSRIQ
jgi:peptidyl-prolyl cis-trans isomerase A (cyclophilin A)